MYRVLLVDDHKLVRYGLVKTVELSRELTVVGEASGGTEALGRLLEQPADLVVTDLDMPGGGLEFVARLHEAHPALRILVLSQHAEQDFALRAFAAGAHGYLTKDASAEQIAAAIRHGVKADGHPMVFMPVGDYHELSDGDTAALVAYVQSLPTSANDPGPTRIGPLGYVLYLFGRFPLLPAESIDHAPRVRVAPTPAVSAEYGKYLAQACTGCHGADLSGQHVPGTPPSFPDAADLTPTHLSAWTNADFRRVLRTGKRPDGSAVNDFMPWRSVGKLDDVEIDALWAYIHSLPSARKAPTR